MREDGRQMTTIGPSLLRQNNPGFSLIELLVVISIIAALLALLIPGLGRAKNLAKRTQCASNLHQIDIAMHLYVNSNDDIYPCPNSPNYILWPGRKWRPFIAPYLGGHIYGNNPSVLLCPSDKVAPQIWESTSYSYSLTFYRSPEQINSTTTDLDIAPPTPQRPSNVARPDGKIITGEWLSNHYIIKEGTDPGWWGCAGRRNYLFVDGQVRFHDANEIRPDKLDHANPNLTKDGIKGIDWPK
jgi:prepilin-type N-terminal cleavage/methylation domain-containing protein/prepilin-type processing-associated H-X9-DG protein